MGLLVGAPHGQPPAAGAEQAGNRRTWFNQVFSYETGEGSTGRTVYFPRVCLHCAKPDCVAVCPTGASYRRTDDGIVLVDSEKCVGCKLCVWACPYGARAYDEVAGIVLKCTLCVERIEDARLAAHERVPVCVAACPTHARHFGDFNDPDSDVSRMVQQRDGFDLISEPDCMPTCKYLPPRNGRPDSDDAFPEPSANGDTKGQPSRWTDGSLLR